jgi:phosphate:Na+ symporter
VGTLTTCLVQSSSVTTVMVVGFVNSGVMKLTQGVGVIMGANIGTTITGWILVLEVGKYGLPILGAAAFVYMFSQGDRWRYWAMAIMGVGMVFFGLELMKDACDLIKDMPAFLAWFHYFDAGNYIGVLMCALAGCVLTMVVQSSSATLGITIALAVQGVIPFETAAALVLGENIGTTITAYLASLGASTNARRAAYFHVFFNVTGVFVITALFRAYLPVVEWIVESMFGIDQITAPVVENGATVFPYVITGIAVTHSVFNIVNTCAFLPFLSVIAGFLERVVKDRAGAGDKMLTHLDYQHFESPIAALELSGHEIHKMATYSREIYDELLVFIDDEKRRKEVTNHIFAQEDALDIAQKEITEFLSDLMSEAISHEDVEISKNQLRLTDEYESVSDYVASILKLHLRLKDHESSFDGRQLGGIRDLHRKVAAYFDKINAYSLNDERIYNMTALESEGDLITDDIRKLRTAHWERLSTDKIDPIASTIYSDVLQSYRKVKDHLVNIAEVHAGLK